MKCTRIIELLTQQGNCKKQLASSLGISHQELDSFISQDNMPDQLVFNLAQQLNIHNQLKNKVVNKGPLFKGDNNGSFVNNLFQIILNDGPVPEVFQDKIARMEREIDLLTQTNTTLNDMLQMQKQYYESQIALLSKSHN